MGLDIYISKNKTVKNNMRTRKAGERYKRTVEITEVLYLRKANQIHRYFVDNYADGIDECQEIGVEIDDIKKLNDICKRIVKESKLADGWAYYEYCESRRVGKGDELQLAKKDGLKFVPTDKVPASEVKVGDYIWEKENHASKIEDIKEAEDGYMFRCGSECVAKIITNPELARELLPTQAGFFFGDTNYNEYYIDDLEDYIRQADEIIADYEAEVKAGVEPYDIDYTYQASW